MSSVIVAGNTSGSVSLTAPDVAGSTVITLPATSGTMAKLSDIPAAQWTTTGSDIYYSTGNVGVGTSTPIGKFTVQNGGAQLTIGNTGTNPVIFGSYSNSAENTVYEAYSHIFKTSGTTINTGTERMRLNSSGSFLVNATSAFRVRTGQVAIIGNAQEAIATKANDLSYAHWATISADSGAGTHYIGYFENSSGTNVGTITHNNTNTTYSTSSDYRLKDNILPMANALATVALLKPVTYTWRLNGSMGQGFIAHELQAVVPDAVTGEKDAVNEDGSIKSQGIDTSYLVATLTAAIQEQQALIENLTTRLSALENK